MCLCQKYGELEIKNAFQSKWGLSYKTFFGSEIELFVDDSAMSLPRVESWSHVTGTTYTPFPLSKMLD
jgi:hypothetical protein